METRVEHVTAGNGAAVEVATIVHEGRDFTALGAVMDLERGIVSAYVSEAKYPKPGESRYNLTGWAEDSEAIAPLTLRGSWKQGGFGGARNTIYAWSCVIDGRVYSGRNSGPCMLIHMRGGRRATGRLNEPAK